VVCRGVVTMPEGMLAADVPKLMLGRATRVPSPTSIDLREKTVSFAKSFG